MIIRSTRLTFLLLIFISYTIASAPTARGEDAPIHSASANWNSAANSATIIGGEDAEEGAWPWMAGLMVSEFTSISKRVYCGGALIADQWILTAAHCTIRNNTQLAPEEIDVVFGASDLTSDAIERVNVIEIIRHPAYFNSAAGHADVALLKLAEPTEIEPLSIAHPKQKHVESIDKLATVLGWGKTEEERRADNLQQVSLPIVSNKTCAESYSPTGYEISENMICAGFQAGGKDACFGDSGGPLVSYDDDTQSWIHIGIVSWGRGCALEDYYGVYTRVSQFHQWLTEQMQEVTAPDQPGDGPTGQSDMPLLVYMPFVQN